MGPPHSDSSNSLRVTLTSSLSSCSSTIKDSIKSYLIFATLTACEYNPGKTKADCINVDEDGDATRWACEKLEDGDWTCVEVKQTIIPVPPELSEAIGKAQGSVKTDVKPDASIDEGANNDTKTPKDLGGLNDDDDGGLTIGPE